MLIIFVRVAGNLRSSARTRKRLSAHDVARQWLCILPFSGFIAGRVTRADRAQLRLIWPAIKRDRWAPPPEVVRCICAVARDCQTDAGRRTQITRGGKIARANVGLLSQSLTPEPPHLGGEIQTITVGGYPARYVT